MAYYVTPHATKTVVTYENDNKGAAKFVAWLRNAGLKDFRDFKYIIHPEDETVHIFLNTTPEEDWFAQEEEPTPAVV